MLSLKLKIASKTRMAHMRNWFKYTFISIYTYINTNAWYIEKDIIWIHLIRQWWDKWHLLKGKTTHSALYCKTSIYFRFKTTIILLQSWGETIFLLQYLFRFIHIYFYIYFQSLIEWKKIILLCTYNEPLVFRTSTANKQSDFLM